MVRSRTTSFLILRDSSGCALSKYCCRDHSSNYSICHHSCVRLMSTRADILILRLHTKFRPTTFPPLLYPMLNWNLLCLDISDRVCGWADGPMVSHWLAVPSFVGEPLAFPIGPSPRVWAVLYMTTSSLPHTLSLFPIYTHPVTLVDVCAGNLRAHRLTCVLTSPVRPCAWCWWPFVIVKVPVVHIILNNHSKKKKKNRKKNLPSMARDSDTCVSSPIVVRRGHRQVLMWWWGDM